MSIQRHYDLVVVGGGLAGCLFLLALRKYQPKLRVLLVEKSDHLAGNHTWCLHDTDIPVPARSWFEPLLSHSWNHYQVNFPEHSRTMSRPYHCIRSGDLAEKVKSQCGSAIQLRTEVTECVEDDGGVLIKLKDGEPLHALSILQARGWPRVNDKKSFGWQKFVGLEVRLKETHSLVNPILKDARVPQIDGYRFFYTLPFSTNELLIEDTYYSNHPGLKVDRIEKEIHQYAEKKGWRIDTVLRREVGALPLALEPPNLTLGDWPSIGAESNFLNPVTGYTLPMTLRLIQALVEKTSFTTASMKRVLTKEFAREKKRMNYYTMLNRMMFLAAKHDQRYKILEHFYRLPESLIDRFYAGQISTLDKALILIGKPPVPVSEALRAIYWKNPSVTRWLPKLK